MADQYIVMKRLNEENEYNTVFPHPGIGMKQIVANVSENVENVLMLPNVMHIQSCIFFYITTYGNTIDNLQINFCRNDTIRHSYTYSKACGSYTNPFFYILQLGWNYGFCCTTLETGAIAEKNRFDLCNNIKTKSSSGNYQVVYVYSLYNYNM